MLTALTHQKTETRTTRTTKHQQQKQEQQHKNIRKRKHCRFAARQFNFRLTIDGQVFMSLEYGTTDQDRRT